MSEQATMDDQTLPADMAVQRERKVSTSAGEVTVRRLDLGGTLRLAGALKRVGYKAIPAGMSLDMFLSTAQREALEQAKSPERKAELLVGYAKSLHAADRLLIEQRAREQAESIVHWIASSEVLLPELLLAVTNLDEKAVRTLDVVDTLDILGTAIELVDWPATIRAFVDFFTRIGGLTAALEKHAGKVLPAIKAAHSD